MKKNYISKQWLPFLLFFSVIILLLLFHFRARNKVNTSVPYLTGNTLPNEKFVTLDSHGFSPQSITVKVGEAVRWKNSTAKDASVNSDDHPTNRLYPELNLGMFTNGHSLVHIFTKPGTYTYHNYIQPDNRGTVIVVK